MSKMYKLTRQDAAQKLNISTRSLDRYIRAGKLRSKKDGKVVYINSEDVESMLGAGDYQHEVIVDNNYNNDSSINQETKTIVKNDENVSNTLGTIYKDLKEEIQKKDQLIQNLAIRVGQAEEVAKNSVSLIDFKKSQYLLEESKQNLDKELSQIEKDKEKLLSDLNEQKTTNKVLIITLVALLIVSLIIFVLKV